MKGFKLLPPLHEDNYFLNYFLLDIIYSPEE